MEKLKGSDVWHRTFRMRRDARFTYELGVNDPLTPVRGIRSASEWVTRSSSWRPDPLNPKRFPRYPRPLSVVELSGAPPQPWNDPKPGVPRGRLRTHKIKSAILANERTVWIYTPAGCESSVVHYGVLILFDGGAYQSWIPTPTILDNLAAAGRIPLLIAALVAPSGPPARDAELACSDDFTRFLAEELVPWIRQTYHAAADPALVIVGGSSFGGLAAAHAAFRHPEIFGNVLSQSAPFMFSPLQDKAEPGWLIAKFAESPRSKVRFHLDVGLMEVDPGAGPGRDTLTSNRLFRDALQVKGYWVHSQEFNGGHDYLNWRGTLADGLIALLGDRT
jgi:enterochelin esterase family protein